MQEQSGRSGDASPPEIESRSGDCIAPLDSLYDEALAYLSGVLSAVRAGNDFDIESGAAIMQRLVDCHQQDEALFIKSLHASEPYDFVVHHSVNVAIYAVKMGALLEYSQRQQIELAMLGLFHDIGIALIPEEIIYKKDRLNPQESHYFRERPRFSYELLKPFSAQYGYLAECALMIYERIDGSGYPGGLRGEEIPEYAQIVGLLDIYEALIHSRPQRQRFAHFWAAKEIIRNYKTRFRRDFLKALLNIFSPFPIQSYVRLNSGSVGQVIATHPDQPMRPKIKVVYDAQRRKVLAHREIDLPENALLFIVDAVSEEELLEISEAAETLFHPGTYLPHEADKAEQDTEAPPENAVPEGVPTTGLPVSDRPKSHRRAAILGLLAVLVVCGGALVWANYGDRWKAALPQPMVQAANRASDRLPGAKDSLPAAAPAASSGFPYSVKLAYFKHRDEANGCIEAFAARGLAPYWVKVDLGNRGVWYRVFAGCFDSAAAAEKFIAANALAGAEVHETRFANRIAGFDSPEQAAAGRSRLQEAGFSPYMIRRADGRVELYVGAFSSPQGAEDQRIELAAGGIQSDVIVR